MSHTPPVLMDLDELAAWLKVSKTTALKLSKHFPCFCLGDRTKRFCADEIVEHLRQERARQEQHAPDTHGLHPRKLKAVS